MTRQEIADYLDGFDVMPISQEQTVVNQRVIDAAAAELRKTCAGCEHYRTQPASRRDWMRMCLFMGVVSYDDGDTRLPADGSGFCHEWSAK